MFLFNNIYYKFHKQYILPSFKIILIFVFVLSNVPISSALSPWSSSQIASLKVEMLNFLGRSQNIDFALDPEDIALLDENFTDTVFLRDQKRNKGRFLISKKSDKNKIRFIRGIVRASFTAYLQGIYIDNPYRYNCVKDLILKTPKIRKLYMDAFHPDLEVPLNEDFFIVDAVSRALELLYCVNNDIVKDPWSGDASISSEKEKLFYLKMFDIINDIQNRMRVFNKGLFVEKEDFFILEKDLKKYLSSNLLDTGFMQLLEKQKNNDFIFLRRGEIQTIQDKLNEDNVDPQDLSKLLDVDVLTPSMVQDLKTRLIEYSASGDLRTSREFINDTIRVAHLIYLNPSIYASEICDRLNLDKENITRLKNIFKTIKENPIFHYLFLNISSHTKCFDTVMFLYNNPEYMAKVVRGDTSVPAEMDFHLSLKECFRDCSHCFNRDRKRTYLDQDYDGRKLEIDIIEKMFEEFKSLGGRTINFSGGTEPTDYKNLPQIMKMAKEKKLNYQLYTNGINISENLINGIMNAERVRISIDAATAETYGKISKFTNNSESVSKETFSRVKNNVRRLIEKRDETGSNVRIGIQFVAQPQNYKEIPDFIEMGRELKVDFINISYDYLKREDLLLDEKALTEISNMIRDVNEQKQKGLLNDCTVIFAEEFTMHEKSEKYIEDLRRPGICKAYSYKMAIDPLGNLFHCCFYAEPDWMEPDKIWGNIGSDKLIDIMKKAKTVNPRECPHCHDFDNYTNIMFDKIQKDKDFGIDVEDQPFISLIEYRNLVGNKKVTPIEALRTIFIKFGEFRFSFTDILMKGLPVSRKNILELLDMRLIVEDKVSPGYFRVSEIFREKGVDREDIEDSISRVYNAKLFLNEKSQRPLFSFDVVKERVMQINNSVNKETMRARIKMELAHKTMEGLLSRDRNTEKKTIKIWSGYFSPAQRNIIAKTKISNGIYSVEFEDDLEELVNITCENSYNKNIVTILPPFEMKPAERSRLESEKPQILFMSIPREKVLDNIIQLEGVMASAVAYLNGDVRKLLYLHKLLTDSTEKIEIDSIEDIKNNPGMLIFYLDPVVIYSETNEFKDLVHSMMKMMSFA